MNFIFHTRVEQNRRLFYPKMKKKIRKTIYLTSIFFHLPLYKIPSDQSFFAVSHINLETPHNSRTVEEVKICSHPRSESSSLGTSAIRSEHRSGNAGPILSQIPAFDHHLIRVSFLVRSHICSSSDLVLGSDENCVYNTSMSPYAKVADVCVKIMLWVRRCLFSFSAESHCFRSRAFPMIFIFLVG